jgi:hypothetical protein
MSADIPGATNALPGPYTLVQTVSAATSIPGGSRVTAMIGQGYTNQTIVAQAQGGGLDGFNPTYTSSVSGTDGRHFLLGTSPVISNRTTIFKNGIPLVGMESVITATTTFSTQFEYLLDIANGEILLQAAYLVDQGGASYVPLSTNVGLGVVNALTLVDQNAPPETWTIRCISVQRNAMNQPIGGTATFIAIGSVSGEIIDANGNPIVWIANNEVVSNGVLSFSIVETQSMSVVVSPFVPGDAFTVIVNSGVLVKNDALTANYIPVANINNPTLTQGQAQTIATFGTPDGTGNTSLSLGAQLFYSNGASSLVCLQAAPALPRRTSFNLSPSINSASTNPDDYVFPLPVGVIPAIGDDIHFFITNNATQVEAQILPNQFPYYELGTAGQPTESQFIFSAAPAPTGYSYFYTVIQSFETLVTGFDGYIGRTGPQTNFGEFSSSVIFDSSYVGKAVKVIDATNVANIATYIVNNVVDGKLFIELTEGLPFLVTTSTFTDFTSESPETFELIDPTTGAVVPGSPGTDGVLTHIINTGTGTLSSTAINFNTFAGLLNLKVQINGSEFNDGLYDILGYSSLTNTLTIGKAIVSETNVRYEVIDPSLESDYIVINQNVVPNGYGLSVTLVDQRDATFYDAGWLNALAALETVECDILVPLPNQTISVIFQNCVQHVLAMSNIVNKKERVLFIGAISGLTPANVTGQTLAAVEDLGPLEGIPGTNPSLILQANPQDLANYSVSAAYGDTYRVVYFYPDQIVVQAGANFVMVDGFYIAAAAAGYESADIILQNPLTNKTISGFTILSNKTFSTLVLEQLAAAGICTLQPVSGGGNVVWGITTSQSGFPEEQEISIVFIRDRVAKTLRASFQGFIGTPQDQNTPAVLNTEAVLVLNSLVGQGLITAYKDLSVSQDSLDPRQWNISVSVSPAYPINWIFITVNVGQLNLGTGG